MYTNQRDEDSCSHHATAKVILQNVWQYFMPVKIDRAKFIQNNCTRFVDFDIYDTSMEELTEAECGSGGYEKIIQFLYVYYLIEEHVTRGKSSDARVAGRILPIIFSKRIPRKFDNTKHFPYLHGLLNKLNTAYTDSKLEYVEIFIYRIPHGKIKETVPNHQAITDRVKKMHKLLFDIIKILVEKGLYIYAVLEQDDPPPNEPRHAVHIINVIGDEVVLKNSWGDNRVYQMKTDGYVWLNGRQYWLQELNVNVPLPRQKVSLIDTNGTLAQDRYENYHEFLSKVKYIVQGIVARNRIREQTNPRIFHRGDVVELPDQIGIFLKYMDKNASILGSTLLTVPVSELRTPARLSDRKWRTATSILADLVQADRDNLKQNEKDVLCQYNLRSSTAALERAKEQKLFQPLPKKTRSSKSSSSKSSKR